jgi:hypothetical protein
MSEPIKGKAYFQDRDGYIDFNNGGTEHEGEAGELVADGRSVLTVEQAKQLCVSILTHFTAENDIGWLPECLLRVPTSAVTPSQGVEAGKEAREGLDGSEGVMKGGK